MTSRTAGRRWTRWIVGGVVVLVVLAVGGPFLYIHVIEGTPPKTFSLSNTTSATNGAALSAKQVDGTWVITTGSQAGYRVQEVLVGQHTTAVGRGSGVSGSLTIAGNRVTAGRFTVDLRTVRSDRSERDAQFNGRIMNTAQFPDAVFTLTTPISLGSIPRVDQLLTRTGAGTLAMHGVTKPVTVSLQAKDTGSAIDITAQIPVQFATWNIANPSVGGFVTTQNNGVVEVSLVTKKA